MKLLLDECVDVKFRFQLAAYGYEVETVRYAGFAGLKNGRLLAAAEDKFDVLVTIDKSIKYQNNFTGKKISVLVIRTASSDLSDILPHVTAVVSALKRIAPGEVIYVGLGSTLNEAERSQRRA
jgi:predicted nuclease of predicted toxin-antitoxin system